MIFTRARKIEITEVLEIQKNMLAKRNKVDLITQEQLKRVLQYDPLSGAFTRIKRCRGARFGEIAGSLESNGYVKIIINRRKYWAHRLAWLYMYGEFPKKNIDHINGIRSDNRIENIRECNRSENAQNRSCRGTTYAKRLGKWRAQITVSYKNIYLGVFESESLAHLAYCEAKAKFHIFNPIPRTP